MDLVLVNSVSLDGEVDADWNDDVLLDQVLFELQDLAHDVVTIGLLIDTWC